MVFVPVGNDNSADTVFILFQIGDIRDNDIYAVKLLVRKTQTAVDNNYVLPVLVNREIFSDLTHTAERDNF